MSKYKITHTHNHKYKYIFTHTSEHTTEIPTIQSPFIARVEKRCPATSSKSHASPSFDQYVHFASVQSSISATSYPLILHCLHSKYYLKRYYKSVTFTLGFSCHHSFQSWFSRWTPGMTRIDTSSCINAVDCMHPVGIVPELYPFFLFARHRASPPNSSKNDIIRCSLDCDGGRMVSASLSA